MKVIKKTFTILEEELVLIEQIKHKCFSKKLDLGVGEIIRLALYKAAKLSEDEIEAVAKKLPRVPQGRPKKTKKDKK